jgi:hypothetical protein
MSILQARMFVCNLVAFSLIILAMGQDFDTLFNNIKYSEVDSDPFFGSPTTPSTTRATSTAKTTATMTASNSTSNKTTTAQALSSQREDAVNATGKHRVVEISAIFQVQCFSLLGSRGAEEA